MPEFPSFASARSLSPFNFMDFNDRRLFMRSFDHMTTQRKMNFVQNQNYLSEEPRK